MLLVGKYKLLQIFWRAIWHPFVELHNEEVIGQEQTDVCAPMFIRDLVLIKSGNFISAH